MLLLLLLIRISRIRHTDTVKDSVLSNMISPLFHRGFLKQALLLAEKFPQQKAFIFCCSLSTSQLTYYIIFRADSCRHAGSKFSNLLPRAKNDRHRISRFCHVRKLSCQMTAMFHNDFSARMKRDSYSFCI